MRIVRATKHSQEARVVASRRPIPLKRYGARLAGRGPSKRVVVNVGGKRKQLERAFIAPRLGSHVFERVGTKRLPIKKLYGPSLGSALIQDAVRIALGRVVAERWPVVYKHEVEFAISRALKRRSTSELF